MKLIGVKIKGFRNIKSVKINFGHLTFLVSTNNYGKSNLLKAIEFAINFIRADRKVKDLMMSCKQEKPLNKYVTSKNFVVDLFLSTVLNKKIYLIHYGFEFAWEKTTIIDNGIIKEWLYVKEEMQSQYTKLISRDAISLYEHPSIKNLEVSKDELILNKLLLYNNFCYYKIIKKLNHMSVNVSNCLKEHNKFNLYDTSEISKVIYLLKCKYKNKYNLLKDAFLQLFPNIEELYVEEINTTSSRAYHLYFKDINLNYNLNFENLSDGEKKIFLMFTNIILADINNVMLLSFKEIENSIHPSLFQSCLEIINQLSENCKIIITTYSPYILQFANVKNIYIGKPNNKGIAYFSKFNISKVNQLFEDTSKYNTSVGTYIFELLSGDKDSTKCLLDYLEN